jgi:hypothetical protein
MSDVPAESAKASRPNKPILSIRARLIVVALLALAPLMLERMRGLEQARAEHAELARDQVIDLAQSGVQAQREIVNSMRALLQVVARVYTRMAPDQADCNQTLADLTQQYSLAARTKRRRTGRSNYLRHRFTRDRIKRGGPSLFPESAAYA